MPLRQLERNVNVDYGVGRDDFGSFSLGSDRVHHARLADGCGLIVRRLKCVGLRGNN